MLYIIVTGNGSAIGDFASNCYGDHFSGKYNLMACFVTEAVLTFIFLIIILGSTDDRAPKGFAGLTLI